MFIGMFHWRLTSLHIKRVYTNWGTQKQKMEKNSGQKCFACFIGQRSRLRGQKMFIGTFYWRLTSLHIKRVYTKDRLWNWGWSAHALILPPGNKWLILRKYRLSVTPLWSKRTSQGIFVFLPDHLWADPPQFHDPSLRYFLSLMRTPYLSRQLAFFAFQCFTSECGVRIRDRKYLN